jgi:hypothetical protein
MASRWTEDELAELEAPETWDLEGAEAHPPVASARAVVPLTLARNELATIEQAAQARGMALTEYMRAAVLADAQAVLSAGPPRQR